LSALSKNGSRNTKWISATKCIATFLELFGLGAGPTFERISNYLKSFGPYFAIIDAVPNNVIRREQKWRQGLQNPAIDEDFIRLIVPNWDAQSEITVGILLDAMKNEEGLFEGIKTTHATYKTNIKELFDDQRKRYSSDRGTRNVWKQLTAGDTAQGAITNKVMLELMRESIGTNERFNETDPLDFDHAVVSISYCKYVVLDKKWARRCRAVNLPQGSATVFDGTEIDKLIAIVESKTKPTE
jgi:hypothetical protein